MQRITKSIIDFKAQSLSNKLKKYYYVDKDQTGYKLFEYNNRTGAWPKSDRLSAKRMNDYLEGLITGIALYQEAYLVEVY